MSVPGADDHREVLSQGDRETPRPVRRVLLTAAAAALLAAGFVVTSQQQDPASEPQTAPSPSPTSSSAPGTTAGPRYDVPTRAPARTGPLAVPTRRDLAGVWLVDRGPEVSWPRGMWLKLHLDGTFTIDPGTALFAGTPWAQGRYDLDGSDLALQVQGGRACLPGDTLRWDVGLTLEGRLVTEHVADNHGRCQVTRGEVWSARPLADRDISRVEGIG